MKRQRLIVLVLVLIVGIGVSTWVNLPPWLVRRRASERYRLGIEHARRGEMDQALAEWRMATRIDSDYPEPYRRLGDYLLNKAERPDLASRIYLELAAIDPKGPHVYCNLTKALALQNEMAEARVYSQIAVKAEPGCGLAHNILGIILLTDQRMKLGLGELERAHAIAPANTEYALVLSKAYLDISDFPRAEQTLAGILAREPGNAEAHYLLGWAFSRGPRVAGNVQKALAHFQESAHLRPDDPTTYSEWGKLVLQTGNAREASNLLMKAWRMNPRQPQVAHNLVSAYRLLGQEQQAKEMEVKAADLIARQNRLRVLQKKLEFSPTDVDVALQLAEMETQDGNLTDAMRYVMGVLRRRQDDRRALQLLTRIYAVGGKPELAESVMAHLRSLPNTEPQAPTPKH